MDLGFILISVLFVGTNIFWVIVVNRLTNKLMSRNFAEYTQVLNQHTHKAKNQGIESQIDPVVEKMEMRRANELNQLMGMV